MGWKQNKQSYVSVILFITILTVVGVLSWWAPVLAQTKAGVIKPGIQDGLPRRVLWGRLKNASLTSSIKR